MYTSSWASGDFILSGHRQLASEGTSGTSFALAMVLVAELTTQ